MKAAVSCGFLPSDNFDRKLFVPPQSGGMEIAMKLNISGNINSYYVQTLCMIFFPGERFSENIEESDDQTTQQDIAESVESGVEN